MVDTLQKQLEMEKSLMVSVPSIVGNVDAGAIREFTESLSSTWRQRVRHALSRIYTKVRNNFSEVEIIKNNKIDVNLYKFCLHIL